MVVGVDEARQQNLVARAKHGYLVMFALEVGIGSDRRDYASS